jgi:hypothetical protein
MQFQPWVLEWGCKSLTAIGFTLSDPVDDPHATDPRAVNALAGLVDARQSIAQRGDVQLTLIAWRYDNQAEAATAISVLSQTGLFAEAVHKMLIGPTVFHLFQHGGDSALTKLIVTAVLDYNAIPLGNGKG